MQNPSRVKWPSSATRREAFSAYLDRGTSTGRKNRNGQEGDLAVSCARTRSVPNETPLGRKTCSEFRAWGEPRNVIGRMAGRLDATKVCQKHVLHRLPQPRSVPRESTATSFARRTRGWARTNILQIWVLVGRRQAKDPRTENLAAMKSPFGAASSRLSSRRRGSSGAPVPRVTQAIETQTSSRSPASAN
jgi:hypothetical protein